MLDVDRGSPNQAFFLPANIKVMSTPKEGDQKHDAKQNTEQHLDEGSLCFFDGFFHRSVYRMTLLLKSNLRPVGYSSVTAERTQATAVPENDLVYDFSNLDLSAGTTFS